MQPESELPGTWQVSVVECVAALLWSVMVFIVAGDVLIHPKTHTVFPILADAGQSWVGGESLYDNEWWRKGLDAFRYSPTAAVVLVPWGVIPLWLGGVLWRLTNVGVLVGSLWWWIRAVLPRTLSPTQRGVLLLVLFPMTALNLRNGQSNPLVLGLLLATTAAAAEGYWWRAAFAIVLASVFKVYPLALGLLIALLFPRRFGWKLAVAVGLAILLPFLAQRPSYVVAEYAEWVHFLQSDVRQYVLLDRAARDVGFLYRVCYWPVDERIYLAMELVAGLSAAAACAAAAQARWPVRQQLLLAFNLGALWMTLFGPATESCTYLLVMPSLAWGLIQSRAEQRSFVIRGLLLGACLVFLTDQIWSWVPRSLDFVHLIMQQGAALAMLVALVSLALTEKARVGSDDPSKAERGLSDRGDQSLFRGPRTRAIASRVETSEVFSRSELP